MAGLLDYGIMQPGPTMAADRERRKTVGSRGLLEALGGPMSFAPNPVVNAIGQGLLGARYLTGEADPTEGAKSLSDMTAMAIGSRLPAPLRNIITYHGSPHKFDKFDSSKIGTGEGAQAYGHGMYLADSPGVAKNYAETLTKYPVEQKLSELVPERKYFDPAEIGEFYTAARDRSMTGKMLWNRNRTLRDIEPEKLQSTIDEIRKAGEGSLYKVDLPDSMVAKMLDWDKPLSQQAPEVQKAMQHKPPVYSGPEYSADELLSAMMEGRTLPSRQTLTQAEEINPMQLALARFREKNIGTKAPSGEHVYRALADEYGHTKAAEMMRKAGIPGIRYLDGGSRGAGQGTSNYVVFPGEEGLLKILERNGQPMGLLDR